MLRFLRERSFRSRSVRRAAPALVLYHAPGCHLCERARAAIAEVRREREFSLTEVDISGDPDLESRYRELLPVVEIDGERRLVLHVFADALRRALDAQAQRPATGL